MGHLFVVDEHNGAIREIDLTTDQVTTVLGVPSQRGVALGPLATARLNYPNAVSVLPGGDLLIVDEDSILRLRY